MSVLTRSAATLAKSRYRPRVEALEDRIVMNGDEVLAWNDVILAAIRATSMPPPRASRTLAIMHAAVYDSVNSIARTNEVYLVDVLPHPNASLEAAVASAAFTTLSALFPTQQAAFNTAYANSLAAIPDGKSENDGVAVGTFVGQQILAIRSTDGSNQTPPPFLGSTGIGEWRPTLPAFAPGLLPFWGTVTPFGINSGDQFQPGPTPAINTQTYTDAYNEVKAFGVATGSTRTADQTQIALFWANGGGTSTPPGHWNVIAQIVAADQGNTLVENARLFALLNIAQADAAISCWDAKYVYNYWRPITAIREGDNDGNGSTTGDAAWLPLIPTPPFPGYTSGHSTFSGAAATVLANFFGTDAIAFTAPSEHPMANDRSFDSFSAAAAESAVSRMYGGIHFNFDNLFGLNAGNQIGAFVAANTLLATNQVVAGLVGGQVRVIGTEASDAIIVQHNRRGRVTVAANGAIIGNYAAALVQSIVVDGRGGGDGIQFHSLITVNSEIFGGDGNDVINGGSGADVIFGENGADVIFGNAGNDQIFGGADIDILFGGLGNDLLRGGDGNDILFGGLGFDDLNGEAGTDFEIQ